MNVKQFINGLMQLVLVVMVMLPAGIAIAADEDIISQVYLEFDPETGEFVTKRDPTLSGNSQSSIGQDHQIEQIQQAQQALVAGQQAAGNPTVSTPVITPVESASTSGSQSVWFAGIAILVLAGGVLFFIRRKNHQTT